MQSSEYGVFLISYQQFIRVVNSVSKFLHANQAFLFIDESHRMKGGDRTDTGRQIQRVAHLPIGKLIMSGTPMPQGESDLLAQYSFLFPNDGTVDATSVKDKIKKIYVRTTKNELLDPEFFPVKIFKTPIPLHEPQKNLYDLIRSEELRQISGIGNNDKKLYRQLGKSYMRLLQVVSNPSLLLKSVYDFPDALREAMADKCQGRKHERQDTAIPGQQLWHQGPGFFPVQNGRIFFIAPQNKN